MKLELIENFETLQQNRSQWDRLAGAFPFHRWAWLGAWFECLTGDAKPAVLVATEDDQWIGIGPFWIDSTTMNSKLRLWGDGKACTDYTGLIARPENLEKFTYAVVDWLTEETSSGGKLNSVDLIELEGITAQRDPDLLLQDSFEASGFAKHAVELEGCWVTELPASWEELNSRLSKSMRRKTKKAAQRTTAEDCEIQSTDDSDFEHLWSIFVDLHQQRRQMLGQPGCFSDPNFESFLKTASRVLIEEGRGQLVVINNGGLPLASMLLFNDVETNYMYQSGADNSRMKLEPGYQMALAAIQLSIDRGFQFFDFLRGDEPYKARWNTTRVPICRVRFVPRKFKAMFKHNLWLTGKALKGYLRSNSQAN
jgi:CelD/BcsL family acetyltransferase involved in cellulose biosynthesis